MSLRRSALLSALLSTAPLSARPSDAPEPPRAEDSGAPQSETQPIEVLVQGNSAAERLRESARAVQVLELEEAKKQSVSMGDVLVRASGVGLRREGGLGSSARLSLNGLGDEQVRVFVDGVPLELAGYTYGVANAPVNLVERVDVYRGVVPIRLGADALGGAIDLVTDDDVDETHAFASHQLGSFGTERLALGVRTLDESTGVFTRVNAFHDTADNDYPIDVEWPNTLGRLEPVRVHRFHDAYRATGANVEAGFVDRPWARRLLFRVFGSDHTKELQHGTVLSVPYGDEASRKFTAGGSVRYEHALARGAILDALAGYTLGLTRYTDPERCLYDWWGRCIREPESPEAHDYLTRQSTAFSRTHLELRFQPGHALRVSLAPTYAKSAGDERAGADPNDGDERHIFTFVGGLEHDLSLFDGRLQNIAFVKGYSQVQRADKRVNQLVLERDRSTLLPGVGDSLRYRVTPFLYAKASYEWATRLPTAREVFGDGVLMLANLDLLPERSHNVNLGVTVDVPESRAGGFRFDVNGFYRDTRDQILALQAGDLSMHQNVFSTRALGAEAGGAYTTPGRHLTFTGNVTKLEFRNTSTDGTFVTFEGDRLPNRPFLFANASARAELRGVAAPNDTLSFTWLTSYVHEFFRSWESIGQRDLKEVIPSQLTHTTSLVYEVQGDTVRLTNAFDVQNVTDARAYDYFGIQRPGRAFYYKLTAEL